MKKLSIAVALFAASTLVHAAPAHVCTGGTAGVSGPIAGTTDGSKFIMQTFTARCSSNVFLDYDQNAKAVGVGAASSKGGFYFAGNSEGGAVAGTACGTNKRCAGAAEAATGAAAGLAAAST